jgi:DNA-directed RNA polymerase subunit RPC12/RpoP
LISLSLGKLAFAYACGLVALLLLLWLSREISRSFRESRQRRRAIHCTICGTLYENATAEPLPPCPQCGQRNERLSPPPV